MDEDPEKRKPRAKANFRAHINEEVNARRINITQLRNDFDIPRSLQRNSRAGSSNSGNHMPKQNGHINYRTKRSEESWRSKNSSSPLNDLRSMRLPHSQNRYTNRQEDNYIPSLMEMRPMRNPGGNYNRKRDNGNKFWIGFKKLDEWSKMDENEVLKELIGRKAEFEEFLECEPSGDKIVLVIKVLAKLCLITFVGNKTEIMNLVSKEKFIGYLQLYIMKLPLQNAGDRKRNRLFWDNIEEFFINLLNILDSIIDTIPTRACEVLPQLLKALSIYIPTFEKEQSVILSEQIKTKLNRLTEKLELHKTKFERKKEAVRNNTADEEDPPDDFRSLSVYPNSEEIVSSQKAFVRRHIIEGSYDSVEHYLDVQFRLLKEDFVAPLREGVCDYLNQMKSKTRSKLSNIRIHSNVTFVTPHYNRDQVGVVVQFPVVQKGTKRNFAYSKRFMYGSLVCFTEDNFATFLFGKVIDRDITLLNKGQVTVGFDAEYNDYKLHVPYIMIECSVFFEPYYHVLKALQNMPDEDFPMKNYLIDVIPRVELPTYLNENSAFTIENQTTLLTVGETWPSSDELNLDNTQYLAYKAALTQKFAVIQGPPGTGKTYLGLRIVKTLLNNKKYWYNNTPILVVCFTNHALDQFLEGLINETPRIVRVGGQSKNNQLNEFNLKNKRTTGSGDRSTRSALFTLKRELRDVMLQIKDLTATQDKINKFQTVIHFRHFENFDPSFKRSWFEKATHEELSQWLLGGHTSEDRRNKYLNVQVLELKEELNPDNTNETINEEVNETWHDQGVDIDDVNDDEDICVPLSTVDLISMETLYYQLRQIEANLVVINNVPEETQDQKYFNNKWKLESNFFDLQDKYQYLRMRLNQGKNEGIQFSEKPNVNYYNPHSVHPDDRWKLYFYWLHLYKTHLINTLLRLQQKHHQIYKNYLEIRNIDDTELMKSMLIVGMTTTGAARLQPTLQALKCRIVVVEEAAEVLESHITVSLTNHCDHLILIGDHQQLRPSTANYNMEKHYNLGISMFERMVRNKVQCNVLGVQHRMRPEIARLISPNIYPILKNHESVYTFPPISGIDSCLYFIDHQERECEFGDSSKANQHEAKYLIRLARYLIQNGYGPEDITILAAYSGQLFTLWNERKISYDFLLKDVKITILDNYQGEECKIILLSLVRNNTEGNVGFLKIENRVCVALSRAKEGFYIMGNMNLLTQNSQIWPKINTTLKEQNAIGEFLTLRCQIHPDETINARKPEDFDKAPEGGCSRVCGAQLNCQHTCKKICHILDRVHEKTQCTSPCSKELCDRNHLCPKMCFEDCGKCMVLLKQTLRCGHEHDLACHVDVSEVKCSTPVEAKLPCGHEVKNKPCYIDIANFRCPHPCNSRVEPCGHSCRRNCHIKDDPDHLEYKCFKPCAKARNGCSTQKHICPKTCHEDCPPCNIVIKKKRDNCSHVSDVQCNKTVDEVPCVKPCKKILECGHYCKKQCFEACGGCVVKVSKELSTCGHSVQAKCSEKPDRKNCNGNCPLMLRCGHPCKNKCKEECTLICKELVDHSKTVDCGHKFKIPCHLANQVVASNSYKLLQYCKEPCVSVLECEHACSGTCGACAQGRVHATCREKCGVPLICGHECPIPCRETCQPCEMPCMFRCQHSQCKKKCGEPCTACNEPCGRKCMHITCKAKCGAMCSVPPCNEPCNKLLPCKHPCVGFCGDPCPPLCRICNEEELTEILLGYEDEIDARFVLLDECKHVIESKGMEQFCKFELNDPENSMAVHYKKCPKCNTPLSSTQRYSDYVKQINRDVVKIKKKSFGTYQETSAKRLLLFNQVSLLQSKMSVKAASDSSKSTLIARIRMRQLLSQMSSQSYYCLAGFPPIMKFLRECLATLQPSRNNKRQTFNLLLGTTLEAKIQIVEKLLNTFNAAKVYSDLPQNIIEYIEMIMKFLLNQFQRITNQEIADFEKELKRLHRMNEFVKIRTKSITSHSTAESNNLRAEIESLLFKPVKYEDNVDENLKRKLTEWGKTVDHVITEAEKQTIVRAMGLQKGHWYKCPNGHYYVITECGGASQVGVCNECKEPIGGTQHRLLDTNRHAGEMDGSRHPAWPGTANDMHNYRFGNMF